MSRPVFWADAGLVTSSATHEVGIVGVIMPMKGVFNNLVIFDQHVLAKQPAVHHSRAGLGLAANSAAVTPPVGHRISCCTTSR